MRTGGCKKVQTKTIMCVVFDGAYVYNCVLYILYIIYVSASTAQLALASLTLRPGSGKRLGCSNGRLKVALPRNMSHSHHVWKYM